MLHFVSMRSISARAWVLVVLSAILQICMFPTGGPMPLWRTAVCWVALAPLLAALITRQRDGSLLTYRNAAYLGYLCGFIWFFGNCFWIYQTMYLYGGLPKPVSFVIVNLFSLYLGLYEALFAVLFALIQRGKRGSTGALLLAPVLWVGVELARARVTGFPWDLLGYAQVDNLLLTRMAPIAGVMGMSFVICGINSALAAWVVPGRRLAVVSAIGFAAALLLQGFGQPGDKAQPLGTRRSYAVMTQENLNVGAVGRQEQPINEIDEIATFSGISLKPGLNESPGEKSGEGFSVPTGTKPALIIWPEAPSHLRSDDPYFRARLSELAQTSGIPAIVGSLGVDFEGSGPQNRHVYDSASVFDAHGSYVGRYDKIHLVPWGEYVPFKQFFSFAQKLTEGVGDMDPGHQRSVFDLDGHRYGVFICYESIFGDEVREFVENGAEVLVNISDDGWYGDTGAPWQHLNMARMRAIENRRWVLRSTNTGVTTAIDPQGRIAVEAPRHVRAAFAFPFGFVRETTFYTRYGDWFAWTCVVLSLIGVGLSLKPRLAIR